MANCVQCGRQLPALSFGGKCQWCKQHEAAQRGRRYTHSASRSRALDAPAVKLNGSYSGDFWYQRGCLHRHVVGWRIDAR